MVLGCVDKITSTGLFTSELKLLRVRTFYEDAVLKEQARIDAENKERIEAGIKAAANTVSNIYNEGKATLEKIGNWIKDEASQIPQILNQNK